MHFSVNELFVWSKTAYIFQQKLNANVKVSLDDSSLCSSMLFFSSQNYENIKTSNAYKFTQTKSFYLDLLWKSKNRCKIKKCTPTCFLVNYSCTSYRLLYYNKKFKKTVR